MHHHAARPAALTVARWRKRIWAAGIALIATLAVAAVTSIVNERRTTLAATARTAEHLTQLLGVVVDQMIRDVDGLAAGLQLAHLIERPGSDGVSDASWSWLEVGMSERPAVRSYYLIDRAGRVQRASNPALIGARMNRRPHFLAHREFATGNGQPVVSDPFVSPVTGYRQLLLSWPLYDGDGGLAAVLAVGFDTDVVEVRLGGMVDGTHDVVALLKGDRLILAAAGIGGTQQLDPTHWDRGLAALLRELRKLGHERAIVHATELFSNDATWVVDAQPLGTIEGSIVLARNLDEVLAQWRWHALAIAFGGALLAVCIVAGASALAGHLGRQGRALVAATNDALTDPLTGLYNRRMLEDRAAAALARASRRPAELTLAVIDIDHFKKINDRYGHTAGDAVLVAVAERLQSLIRRDDVLARIGGEEFAILMAETPIAAGRRQAERLRQAIESLRIDVPGGTVQVTISVGIARASPPQSTLGRAFEAADSALYEAKSLGRNRTIQAGPTAAACPAGA